MNLLVYAQHTSIRILKKMETPVASEGDEVVVGELVREGCFTVCLLDY